MRAHDRDLLASNFCAFVKVQVLINLTGMLSSLASLPHPRDMLCMYDLVCMYIVVAH
jgi:hypothetical protein